ncbi:hypothetical protein HELRODRAFT_168356 [Helobdella robusta]|uniref:Uncharacterized protein n=1 Tax=Helobdella robusta TaxID=6412 RepID=T1F0G5_HELRO|nr:hypothetical protein HELRODRAFT_168356 [Helobdella robusta]ESO09375.1 hypothetical protein HELRODRAFT_168356 [Helobdella robusta]
MEDKRVDQDGTNDEGDLSKIWSEFASVTTSHGIQRMNNAKSKKYLKYEVDVNFKVEQAKSLKFPAVTICNNNPIRKSLLKSSPAFEQIHALVEEYVQIYKFSFCRDNDSLSEDSYENEEASDCIPFSEASVSEFEKSLDTDVGVRIKETYEALEESYKFDAGHQFDQLILDCEFAGVSCMDTNDFVHTVNNVYGNCYTFNSALLAKEIKVTKLSGPKYGLKITFNVEQNEYIETSETAGLRVLIHDPQRMPFPEDEGFLVATNALTHVAVEVVCFVRGNFLLVTFYYKETMLRMNGSYGNCYAEGLPKETNYQHQYNLSYCQKGCHYTRLSEEIYHRRACVDVKFTAMLNVPKSRKICSTSNEIEKNCANETLAAYEDGLLFGYEMCPPPCKENIYKTSISSSKWPAKNTKDLMASFIDKICRVAEHEDKSCNIDIKDCGMLFIYFETLSHLIVEESPSYEFHQLLSDIGGVLGLYIGFSLLTIVEFIELIFEICRARFRKRCLRRKKISNARSAELRQLS